MTSVDSTVRRFSRPANSAPAPTPESPTKVPKCLKFRLPDYTELCRCRRAYGAVDRIRMLMNVTCWQLLHTLRQSRQHHAAHLPDVIMTYNVYATRCASGMFLSSVSFKTCSDIILKTCPHGVRVPLPSNSLFAFLFFLRDSNINEGQNTNLHRFCAIYVKSRCRSKIQMLSQIQSNLLCAII